MSKLLYIACMLRISSRVKLSPRLPKLRPHHRLLLGSSSGSGRFRLPGTDGVLLDFKLVASCCEILLRDGCGGCKWLT